MAQVLCFGFWAAECSPLLGASAISSDVARLWEGLDIKTNLSLSDGGEDVIQISESANALVTACEIAGGGLDKVTTVFLQAGDVALGGEVGRFVGCNGSGDAEDYFHKNSIIKEEEENHRFHRLARIRVKMEGGG